jgi:uncharacterized protein (DUF433 family)
MSVSMLPKTRRPSSDPRELPAYGINEAAEYLWVHPKSLRRWATGETGRRRVIQIADPARRELSFLNLAELHVLSFLRGQRVPLQRIRRAVDYLHHELGKGHPHPLLAVDLLTDGLDVFVEELTDAHGRGSDPTLVNLSRAGQYAMRELLKAHLKRLERDETENVLRFYPFDRAVTSAAQADQLPRHVAIDPLIAFGRPVIAGTRVPTTEIASRFKAGEPLVEIAQDMRLDAGQIEAALRYHTQAA